LLFIIFQILLILKSLKVRIKIFSILLIFVFSIAIISNTKEAKIVFNVIFFFTKFCFLLLAYYIY